MAKINIPIVMKRSLKEEIDWLSTNYDKEIAGWITGTITKDKIILEELLIPHQEVGGASVDMDGKQIAQLRKEYGNKCKRIIGEWHSHVGMGCFWSSTDEDLIEQFMKPRKMAIFIVSSKGKHLVRLESKEPFKISIDKLKFEVEEDTKVKKKLEKEIKKKVTEKSYPVWNQREYNGYGWARKNDNVCSTSGGWQKNLYDDIPFEKITRQEKRFKKDDDIKERIKSMMKYNDLDKSVVVSDIPWYYADGLYHEFESYNPTMIQKNWERYKIVFKPENKEYAIDLMKDLKSWLTSLLNEVLSYQEDF